MYGRRFPAGPEQQLSQGSQHLAQAVSFLLILMIVSAFQEPKLPQNKTKISKMALIVRQEKEVQLRLTDLGP